MAGPLFGYILTTQVAFLVVQNVANAASNHASYDGFPAYSYAWQLFQMPYAIVGISVITALLPRMSAHASEKNYSLVRSDFSGGVRLSSVIVVPAALILAVLGAPFAEALFGYGSTTVAQAHYIGMVFGIFSLGLVPYMMFQLMLRVFYAMHDSRTPMYIGVGVMATNIAASLLALAVLPALLFLDPSGAADRVHHAVELAEGRIAGGADHPALEFLDQPLGTVKDALVVAHVDAIDEHRLIAPHLFCQRFVERLAVSDRPAHARTSS